MKPYKDAQIICIIWEYWIPYKLAQSAGAVEYTDSISAKG